MEIGTWEDGQGRVCCIHLDKKGAEETLGRIRRMREEMGERVEVVLGHDERWREKMRGLGRMYPGVLE